MSLLAHRYEGLMSSEWITRASGDAHANKVLEQNWLICVEMHLRLLYYFKVAPPPLAADDVRNPRETWTAKIRSRVTHETRKLFIIFLLYCWVLIVFKMHKKRTLWEHACLHVHSTLLTSPHIVYKNTGAGAVWPCRNRRTYILWSGSDRHIMLPTFLMRTALPKCCSDLTVRLHKRRSRNILRTSEWQNMCRACMLHEIKSRCLYCYYVIAITYDRVQYVYVSVWNRTHGRPLI